MMYISKYIFSLLVLASASAFAQQKNTDTIAPKPKVERYGIRVGADLHRISRSFYDDDFKGIELVADYRLTKKIYAAAELGNTKITVDEAQLNFTANGNYIKLGFNYNTYQNWLDMENMIYVGVRYGFSTFKQTLNSYKIYQNSDILPNDNISGVYNYFNEVTIYPNREYSSLTAHWAEIVGGVKVELLNNIYMGFSVRLNIKLAETEPDGFANLYIPGFNRTYDGSFGVGFNYTLSYFIPFYKKQEASKEVKKK